MANQSLVDLDKKPYLYNNLEDFDNSRRKIIAVADYVIPGHGEMFKIDK